MATTVEYVPDLQGGGGGGGGNGFAGGATVANSIGNTPANGFTLSDTGNNTGTFAPGDVALVNTDNASIIELSNNSHFIKIGNSATFGASTLISTMDFDVISLLHTSDGSGVTLSSITDTALIEDTLGNIGTLGSPNGAGLTLTGAGGTSITEDGTIPSTTWDDGAGGIVMVVVSGGSGVINLSDVGGDFISIGGAALNFFSGNGNEVTLDANTPAISLGDSTGAEVTIGSGVAPVVAAGQFGIGSTHQTTVGALGSASALPALPLGYWLANVEGTAIAIPYYAAS